MHLLKQITTFFTKPFNTHLCHLIVITLLIATPDLYLLLKAGDLRYCLYMMMSHYLTAFFLVLLIGLPKPNSLPKKILTCIIYSLVCATFAVDVFCIFILKSKLCSDFIFAMRQTNISEASEFIQMYIRPSFIILLFFAYAVIYVCFRCINRLSFKITNPKIEYTLIIFTIILSALVIRNSQVFYDGFYGKTVGAFFTKTPPNLESYWGQIRVLSKNTQQPDNIVIIIGESFSKYHSQINGYHLNTTPHLQKLVDNKIAYSFDSVISPSTNTTNSFKALLNTWCYGDSINWYETPTIIEFAHKAGYVTTWLSNQNSMAKPDIIPNRFAKLCDFSFFIKDSLHIGFADKCYDGNIMPFLKEITTNPNKNNLYFIHLMGQHGNYSDRFPEDFTYFTPNDYPDYPPKCRQMLADYDNATLYNDSIVYSIYLEFKSKDAILIYVPDHGEDVFTSSKDYAGHSIPGIDPEMIVGRQIPFVIITTPSFQVNHKSLNSRIAANTSTQFNTENLFYTIVDIMGYQFMDSIKVSTRSLLKPQH